MPQEVGAMPEENTTAEEQPQTQSAPAPEDSGQSHEIIAMREHISRLNEENKKHRLRAKEEAAQRDAALNENGQFKALAESLKARLEEIESGLPELQQKAALFDEYRQKESERVEKEIQTVPEHWREVLTAAPDLETKARILQTLKINKPEPAATGAPTATQNQPTAREVAKSFLQNRAKSGGHWSR